MILGLPRDEAVEEYKNFLRASFKKLTKNDLANRLIVRELLELEKMSDEDLSTRIALTTRKVLGLEKKE